MALKGKKKSRSRGSQARRRPASAPRPTYGGRDKRRWYQTTQGLVIGFVVLVSLIIVVWWWVADSRSETQALEQRQEELQTYTESVRALIDQLSPVTTELAGASALEDGELTEQVKEWKNDLATAQTAAAQVTPPAGAESLSGLVTQAVLLYVQSAEQWELIPKLEGDVRQDLAGKAAGSFQAATSIFASAIQLLDDEREGAELAASGLTTPGQDPTTAPEPGEGEGDTTLEFPEEEEGDNAGGGGNAGNGGNDGRGGGGNNKGAKGNKKGNG